MNYNYTMFGFSPTSKTFFAAAVVSLAALAIVIFILFKNSHPNTDDREDGAQRGPTRVEIEISEKKLEELKNLLNDKRALDKIIDLRDQTETRQEIIDSEGVINTARALAQDIWIKDGEFPDILSTGQHATGSVLRKEEAVLPVTDEEVFIASNTREYIDSLSFLQDQLIQLGEVKAEERVVINSEEAVVIVFIRILNYLEKHDFIALGDSARYKNYLQNEYIALRKEEAIWTRYQLEQARRKTGFIKPLFTTVEIFKKPHPKSNHSQELTVLNLIKIFKKALLSSKETYAAWVNAGPICYKDDNPFYAVPGPNLWAPCCNCGLQCGKVCVYVHDCGPYSVGCNVPLGCLNLTCRLWPNAIWNPLTGVCGCG